MVSLFFFFDYFIEKFLCFLIEGIDGRYQRIQNLVNTLTRKVHFKVSTSHPLKYRIVPESGALEVNDSIKVQIILKEFCSDYRQHVITVEFLLENLVHGQQSLTLHTSHKIKVELCSKSNNPLDKNKKESTKENSLNRSVMELEIRRSIQTGDYFLNTEGVLFPNPRLIPKALKEYFTKYYDECLVNVLKSNLKTVVTSMMKNGKFTIFDRRRFNENVLLFIDNTEKIQDFRDQRNTLNLQSPFWKPLLDKNQTIQLNNMLYLFAKSDSTVDKAGQPVIASAKKYFDMCMTLFYDEVAEAAMRQLFVTWFKSGYMKKAVFHAIKSLKDKSISPHTLKSIKWQALANNDHYSKSFERILQSISADEFFQKDELQDILNVFAFEATEIKSSQDSHSACVLTITGRIIFLSDVIGRVEAELKQNTKINEVQFYAKNVFNIDANLENPKWHGKNVVIVTDKVHVWASHVIDVSGIGYDLTVRKKRAGDGKADGENGKDGADGQAGESSGNIVLLTEELFGGDLLTLKLNGGNGEHGEDGGNGANGKNGCGVTKTDLESLILKYSTLYWGGSQHFFDFTPTDTEELFRKFDTYNKYVYARFKDKNGRVMYWCYAEDYSYWSTSTYDLYFMIAGSQGTAGGVGGRNGVSGEGGNRGDCTVRTLYSGKELLIKNIQKNPGRSGEHGILGKPGHFGKNGNDMAFVDRSTISSGKKYIGTEGNMSISFNFRLNQNESRIDGYEKWFVKRAAYYVHFAVKAVEEGAIMEMKSELKTNADRKSESKTTSKASIIISNVVSKLSQCFAQDDATIAEACQAQEQAEQEENDEDEEKNEEAVAEEMSVLLDCVEHDTGLMNLYGSKKSRSIWTKFVQRIKSYETSTVDTSIELALELFQHETNTDELEPLDAKLKQLIHDVKNFAAQLIPDASKFSFTQIRVLASNIDDRLQQKKIQTQLRSQNDVLFEKYFSTAVDGNITMNSTTNTLIGIKRKSEYRCE